MQGNDPQAGAEPTRGPEAAGSPGPPRPAGTALWAWAAAWAVAGGVAFRSLLLFQPERALPEELEAWFFVPSETISPLVVLLAGWLFYRRSARLRALPREPGSLAVGGLLLGLAVAIHAWATWTGANDLLPPALMASAAAALWLWRGGAAVGAAALPIAFLAFAMATPAPLLNEIVYRLQIGTADLASFFLYGLGVPHFVAGEQIQRTQALFSVIESCSGLRSIEILTMVAILMADLFRRGPLHSWLLVLVAPVVAFFLNGLRALLLILNPHSEVAAIHNLQGVGILLGGLVVLFFWDGLLERLPARAPRPPAPTGRGRAPNPLAPVLLTAALTGMAAISLALPRWQPDAPQPFVIGGVLAGLGLAEKREVDRSFLGSTGFHETLHRSVSWGRRDALLFVGIGARVHRTRSPISPKTELPGSGWVTEQESQFQLDGDGKVQGPTVTARVMRSGSRRWLVHHWYEGRAGFAEEALRAWLALDRSPWRSREEIVAVRVGIPLSGAVGESRPEAEEEFLSFYDVLRPLLSGLRAQAAGKKFSVFRRSGKTFSARRPARNEVVPLKFSYLEAAHRSARDLLIHGPGATGAPRGSSEDLRSLGRVSRTSRTVGRERSGRQ